MEGSISSKSEGKLGRKTEASRVWPWVTGDDNYSEMYLRFASALYRPLSSKVNSFSAC